VIIDLASMDDIFLDHTLNTGFIERDVVARVNQGGHKSEENASSGKWIKFLFE
jgi:hypothetical protein